MVPSYQTMGLTHTIFSFFFDCWKAVINLRYNCNKLSSAKSFTQLLLSIMKFSVLYFNPSFIYGPYKLPKILSEPRWHINKQQETMNLDGGEPSFHTCLFHNS